jgi:predicted nuclease of restriction endonuclease-like (RecB) superfamily
MAENNQQESGSVSDSDNKYISILFGLKEKIRLARQRAALAVNSVLLQVYWEIGNTILEKQNQEGWGTKIIDRLAKDLKLEFPDMNGLSVRNLKYMRAFAEAYPQFVQQAVAQIHKSDNQHTIIVQQAVAQLPWGHHLAILTRLKSYKERQFYIDKTAEYGWSRDVLVHQIESGLHLRQGALSHNFNQTLPEYQSDLTRQLFKDPYNFDFLMLSENAKERDLENALISSIKDVLLELGEGFAFMGRQYCIMAGEKEYFIDLLFYHTRLHRYVVIELKIGDFEPEYVGKMNMYLGLIDDKLKTEKDDPAIGLILCKTKDRIIAEYALRDTSKPIGIAEYKLLQLLPEDIKGELPTIEDIEKKLDEEIKEHASPADKKLDALKQKLAGIKSEEIQTPATNEIIVNLYKTGLKPLFIELMQKLEPLNEDFTSCLIYWLADHEMFSSLEDLEEKWFNEKLPKLNYSLSFSYRLQALKKSGVNAISCSFELAFIQADYSYGFKLTNYNNQQPFFKKLYHQELTKEDRNFIIETAQDFLLDEINRRIDNQ